jgi:hypothetical protein
MTKTSKIEKQKRGAIECRHSGKVQTKADASAQQAPIGQRMQKRFYDGQKKARWGDGLETCFLTDGFTLLKRT